MVASVGMSVDSALEVRMLGPMTFSREGCALALPGSRKLRALFAYLALAPRPVTRSQLCELLWDVPNDPRGELRWSLSKIRGAIDEPGRQRVCTRGETVWLDLSGCFIDALSIAQAAEAGIGALVPQAQRNLLAMFRGDFLDGLELEHSPLFGGWLTAQRRRFRGCQVALLEHLAKAVDDDEAAGYLQKWLELSPFDRRAHQLLLEGLARQGRMREAEEHLAATARLFQAEGLDCAPIREAWRIARGGAGRVLVTAGPGDAAEAAPASSRRASIAVMPFADDSSVPSAGGGHAHALAHDVITRLAKLRSMFVIAQGTVFALHARHVGAEEAGRILNVDYTVSGSVRNDGKRLTVAVELAETRSMRIVWSEVFNRVADDALLVLEEMGNRIVGSIASEVELIERNRAILRPPSSLDAWEAHHRGLWHMYRFSRRDNEQARQLFQAAIRMDPTFSRAYAGLSFTHWQEVFQGWARPGPDTDRAFEAAGQSVMADDRDPAAHWAMGRALWLRGRHAESVAELERAIDLSPNFALGHYNLAFVHGTAGNPESALKYSDYSRELSPFDPMLFGMLGSRAMALVRLQRFDEAAKAAVAAAARPNAFTHIQGIAACALALAGDVDAARPYVAKIRSTNPDYSIDNFLTAFKFDAEGAEFFRQGAQRIGMA